MSENADESRRFCLWYPAQFFGIAGGFVMANVARLIISRWVEFPAVHTPLWAILGAFSFCALLGVVFGIYPAAKASKLDPIEALRWE